MLMTLFNNCNKKQYALVGLLILITVSVVLLNEGNNLTITVQWSQPIEFENGEELHPGEVQEHHIEWENENGDQLGESIVSGNQDYFMIPGLDYGVYSITVRSKSVYGTMSMPVTISKELEQKLE